MIFQTIYNDGGDDDEETEDDGSSLFIGLIVDD